MDWEASTTVAEAAFAVLELELRQDLGKDIEPWWWVVG